MKRLMIMALLGLVLVGCDARPGPDGTPVSTNVAYTASTYDSRYGVVCYRYATSSNNLSCVKVE